MDNSPPMLWTGPTHSETHAEQGKSNALPATACEPQGTQWA
jgi:hypothetical protein